MATAQQSSVGESVKLPAPSREEEKNRRNAEKAARSQSQLHKIEGAALLRTPHPRPTPPCFLWPTGSPLKSKSIRSPSLLPSPLPPASTFLHLPLPPAPNLDQGPCPLLEAGHWGTRGWAGPRGSSASWAGGERLPRQSGPWVGSTHHSFASIHWPVTPAIGLWLVLSVANPILWSHPPSKLIKLNKRLLSSSLCSPSLWE